MPRTSAGLLLWRRHRGSAFPVRSVEIRRQQVASNLQISNESLAMAAAGEQAEAIEVLIAHPGGPFWANRHEGAWSIPKGEFDPASEPGEAAAAREFTEELGAPPPVEGWVPLGQTRLKSGKVIHAWAVEGAFDPDALASNTFRLEWPSGSRRWIDVPEVDAVSWCSPDEARQLLNPAQAVFVDRLLAALAAS